jgi:hypothetical protein
VVAPKPPVLHTLTGLGWYSQSAGRAVNQVGGNAVPSITYPAHFNFVLRSSQCIGRVIRHNRDWGTVFLLDDR